MECKSTKFFLNCNPLTAFHRGIFPLVQTASHAAEKISLYLSWSIGTTSNAPTVKSVNNRFHNYPMEHTYKPTFFVLSWIEKYLHLWGLSDFIANVITFVLACGLILLILWALNYIGTWTLTHVVTRAVRLSKTQWDDFLLHRHFFNRIIKCLTGVLLLVTARLIFAGYHPSIITAVEVLSRIFITVMGALTCGAFLNALNDIYESKPIARRKSIKGLIQAAKIALYFIMGIVVIAILICWSVWVPQPQSSPWYSRILFWDLSHLSRFQPRIRSDLETGSRCPQKGLTVLLLTLMSHTSRCATGTIR